MSRGGVFTNFLNVITSCKHKIFTYEISSSTLFEPKIVEELLCSQYPSKQFFVEGICLIVVGDLSSSFENPECLYVDCPISNNRICIELRPVSLEFSPAQLLHAVIARAFVKSGYVEVGQSFFDTSRGKLFDNGQRKVWPGYKYVVKHGKNGQLLIGFETVYKVVNMQNIAQILELNESSDYVTKIVDGKPCISLHDFHQYRIVDIDLSKSPHSTFCMEDGRCISYAQYYLEKYGYSVVDMEQPLLRTACSSGTGGESVYLIPELVHLTPIMGKDMKEIEEYTHLTPLKRVFMIQTFVDYWRNDEDLCKLFREWGFTLSDSFKRIPVERLPKELYLNADDTVCEEEDTTVRCAISKELTNWVIIAPNTPVGKQVGARFQDDVVIACGQNGMKVEPPGTYLGDVPGRNGCGYRKLLKDIVPPSPSKDDPNPIQMVVVILPDDNPKLYEDLKKMLCLETPVCSQFVRLSTLLTSHAESVHCGSIVDNIVKQMNCKIGGSLRRVKIPFRKGMVVGYSTTSSTVIPDQSTSGCVSSIDQDCTQWFTQTKTHSNDVEMFTYLENMVKKSLRAYFDANEESLPTRLFVYRELNSAQEANEEKLQNELTSCISACEHIQRLTRAEQPIRVCFIVVNRRNHFHPFTFDDDSVGNLPVGTVISSIDGHMVHSDEFYLLSNDSLHMDRDSSSVKYRTLLNQTGFDGEQLKKVAFKLCHLYYNCARPIGVPAPCLYARKVCSMVGDTLKGKDVPDCLRDKLYYL